MFQENVIAFPFKTNCRSNQLKFNYLFVEEKCYGLFASYDESKGFPQNFSDCVANFCDPPAWGENLMYDDYEKRHTKTCPDVIKMQKETFMVQIEHALKFNLPFVKLTLIILRQLCVAQHLFQ